MNRSSLISAIAIASIVLSTAACNKGGFSKERKSAGSNVLRYSLTNNPVTLDPALAGDLVTGEVMNQTMEGLVAWGEDNAIKPMLAESWEVSPDGKVYTFKIKKGVKFSNGRDLTAEDFKWTWERNSNPKLDSLASNYLNDIVGVKDKLEGKADSLSGVKVVDPQTLEVTIDAPKPYFLGKLTYPVAAVLAKEAATDQGITKAEALVSTGPFMLKRFVPDSVVEMEANPHYHGGVPGVSKLEILILKDAATRMNKYRSGDLDYLALAQQDIKMMESDGAFKEQLERYDRPGIIYLGLNPQAYKPFANPGVRKAFAMAVDREKIVNQFLGGFGRVADGIMPPSVIGTRRGNNTIPFDPSGAKKLLADAGYPGGKGLPPLKLLLSDQSPERRMVADAVATQLNGVLGVQVSAQPMEFGAYLQQTRQKKAGFFLGSWYADYLDAENFLSVTLGPNGQNRVNYNNPQFAELVNSADVMTDPIRRTGMYLEAERIALDDAPWVPLYFPVEVFAIRPHVSGIRNSAFGFLPHVSVKVAKTP